MDHQLDLNSQLEHNSDLSPERVKHTLPALAYDYSALEPYIDSRTLMLHHTKHHAAYVANLNIALDKYPELYEHKAEWLLCNLQQVPKDIRVAVRHNAGGHINHSLFWETMSPTKSSITGPLEQLLNRDFGSIERFKTSFVEAGEKLFGSGWVWLVRGKKPGSRLQITTTLGHDNPIMKDCLPLLVNDVWEHAYYLKYENRRTDYLNSWWSIVNWQEVARRFENSD